MSRRAAKNKNRIKTLQSIYLFGNKQIMKHLNCGYNSTRLFDLFLYGREKSRLCFRSEKRSKTYKTARRNKNNNKENKTKNE